MRFTKWAAGLALVAIVVGACSSTAATATPGSGGNGDRARSTIEVVTHGQASDPFWSIFKNGVDPGRNDMGVNVEYSAPHTFDMNEMAQLIDAAVRQEAAGPRRLDPGRHRARAQHQVGGRRRHPGHLRQLRIRRAREPGHPDPRRTG